MEKLSIILGKLIQKIIRITGRGGSAFPGLVVEKINPNFIKNVLARLPHGVLVISGTNGKTTTTKIVTEILEKQGLKVFTNKSGSNFVRGIISEILNCSRVFKKFNYDIAVLELDEAHAVKFCEVVPIDYALLLNAQRDQLDRFGEIDYTAKLLQSVASSAKNTVVLNREDPRISKITTNSTAFFGLSNSMLATFPSDDNLIEGGEVIVSDKKAVVTLEELSGSRARYRINEAEYEVDLTLKGIYNAYNAAGALALCKCILKDISDYELVNSLKGIESAFGRGESFNIEGCEVEILLVKNPSAFQLSIASFVDDEHDYMIAINDNYADGCDVSWLWNVDFSSFPHVSTVSGVRATDMALRLKYDNVTCDIIEENLEKAISIFTKSSSRPKCIFTTYTAMLAIRKIISGKSIL